MAKVGRRGPKRPAVVTPPATPAATPPASTAQPRRGPPPGTSFSSDSASGTDSSDNSSDSARSGESLFDSYGKPRRDDSAATTPASSVPQTPAASAHDAVRDVLARWSGAGSKTPPAGQLPALQVHAALVALRRSPHDARWTQAYDVLLSSLATRGAALSQSQQVGTYLRRDAAERVRVLHREAASGRLHGREVEALATVGLLRKLKHDHATKALLVAVEDALTVPHAGTQTPSAEDASPPAAATNRATATLAAQPSDAATPPTLQVRKRPLDLATRVAAALTSGPVSTLSLATDPGEPAAPPLALVGATVARGSFAKVRPVALLAAGRALVGDDPGPWVLRRTHETTRHDPAKANLRAPGHRATKATSAEQRDEEAANLAAARSPLRPVARLQDAAGNTWDLVRLYHGTAEQALNADAALRRGRVLARTVLEGTLPTLHNLHGAGRAHFDIKPDNLFVDAVRATVVLGDFGLAKRLVPGERTQRGTYRYQAPELYTHGGQSLTPAVDLYGLAVTLAKLLAPDLLVSSPLNLPEPQQLAIERQDITARAPDEAQRLGLRPTPQARALAAVSLLLQERGEQYRAWYARRGPELTPGYAGPAPRWRPGGYDALFARLVEQDPIVAHLVARGLHPDPTMRGDAQAWQTTLEGAPALAPEERTLWQQRLARANRGHSFAGVANDAHEDLLRLAREVEP